MTISSCKQLQTALSVTPNGVIDKEATYDEFLENEELQKQVDAMYKVNNI